MFLVWLSSLLYILLVRRPTCRLSDATGQDHDLRRTNRVDQPALCRLPAPLRKLPWRAPSRFPSCQDYRQPGRHGCSCQSLHPQRRHTPLEGITKERRNIRCSQKWEKQHSSARTVAKPSKPSTPRAASEQASTCRTARSVGVGIRRKQVLLNV